MQLSDEFLQQFVGGQMELIGPHEQIRAQIKAARLRGQGFLELTFAWYAERTHTSEPWSPGGIKNTRIDLEVYPPARGSAGALVLTKVTREETITLFPAGSDQLLNRREVLGR